MKTSIAVTLTICIIMSPIIATIIFGILIFNEIKLTSIISIPIFCLILLLHIFIIYITYRKYNRSTEFTCRISAPYYDFFLLILQIGFVIFGILLAIVNMQNSNGKCSAFVSSSSVVSDDGDKDDRPNTEDENLYIQFLSPTVPTTTKLSEDPDDMDSGSASCGGVTVVFLIACIILCLKLFTLPILKNLTSLTKQIRSSTMHPQTADPRIRINAFSMHETFNAPTAASGIPRLPSATFSHSAIPPSPRIDRSRPNSSANLVRSNSNNNSNNNHETERATEGYAFFLSIPPPPSYQESLQALPPSYENLSNLP